MAGYVSSGGRSPLRSTHSGLAPRCLGARERLGLEGEARRPSRGVVPMLPLAPFGASAGLVLAFRVRARRLLPFEGVESISCYQLLSMLRPARSVPRNVTG